MCVVSVVASHFTLGQHQPLYETESMSNLHKHPLVTTKNPLLAVQIRQTHFTLGDVKKPSYQTVYAMNLKPHNLADAYTKQAPNKNFTASFQIGMNDHRTHVTESQMTYKKIPSTSYLVDSGLKANIRFIKGSHFSLGTDKNKEGAAHFLTLNEEVYRPKKGIQQAVLNKEKLNDLRKSHFEVGNMSERMYTQNQAAFTNKSKNMPAFKLVSKNLRESHFSLGYGKPEFMSQTMLQFRDPKYVC